MKQFGFQQKMVIFSPNKEEARNFFVQWCEDMGETFSEENFKECYIEVTFDYYNYNYAR